MKPAPLSPDALATLALVSALRATATPEQWKQAEQAAASALRSSVASPSLQARALLALRFLAA